MRPDEIVRRLEALAAANEALTARVEALERGSGAKQRGPKTDRAMTDEDAFRVKFGDLKSKNHKEAAEATGLSYGQVFSCRGGYTFKHVKSTWTKPTDAPKEGE